MQVSRASQPVAAVLLLVLWPTLGLAQSPAPTPAGVVTGLQGRATVARPVVTQPIPLNFKDDVFLRDRIETQEKSLVRVLLGGKAVVTVRELSRVTFVDEPGRAVVDLKSGKIAVGVAKSLLKPGESIDIHTPNAVSAIRGSLLIASVATVGGLVQTTFTALDADPKTPITVTPKGGTGGAVTLGVNDTVAVSGSGANTVLGPVQKITPDAARREAQTASAPLTADPQALVSPMAGEISQANSQQATALASLIAPQASGKAPSAPEGSSTSQSGESTTVDPALTSASQPQLLQEQGSTLPVVSQSIVASTPTQPSTQSLGVNPAGQAAGKGKAENSPSTGGTGGGTGGGGTGGGGTGGGGTGGGGTGGGGTGGGGGTPPTPPPTGPVVISGQNLVLGPDDTLKTFSGTSTSMDTTPAVTVTNSTVCCPDNLIKVEPGAVASLQGPLMAASGPVTTPSLLYANSSVVDIRGAISSASASAFISVDPTIHDSKLDFVRIVGGSLKVAGPLLTDLQGLYLVFRDFLSVSGGGSLTGTSSSDLLQFSNSSVLVGASETMTPVRFFAVDGSASTATLGGSLASLANSSVLSVNGDAGSALLSLGSGAVLKSPSTSPVVNLSGSTIVLGAGVRGLLATGGTATVGGDLIRASGESAVLADQTIPIVDLSAAAVSVSGALVRLENGSTLQSGGVKVSGGSLAADSLIKTDGAGNTWAVQGTALDLSNSIATLRTPEDKPAVDSDTTSLTLGPNQPAFRLSSSTLTLTGPGERLIKFGDSSGSVPTEPGTALVASGTAGAPSTLNLKGTLLELRAVNSTASEALVQLDHTAVNQTATTDPLITALVPPALVTTMAGPLLSGVSTTIKAPGNLFHLAGGSVASNTGLPFFFFDPVTANSSIVNTGQQTILVDNGSFLSLKGPLLSAQGTAFKMGDPTVNAYGLFQILDGAKVTSTGTSPLLTFDASSTDGGAIVSVRRSPSTLAPSTLTISGPLSSAINESNFDTSSLGLGATLKTAGGACCSAFSIAQGGQLTSTTTAPLIQLTNSTIKAGPDAQSGGTIFNVSDTITGAPAAELVAPSSVSLSGPLLSAGGGSLTGLFSLLQVARSNFSSTSPDPLIQLNDTTVNLGGHDPIANATSTARLLNLVGSSTSPGTLKLKGTLLSATDSNITTTSEPFGIFAGGTLTQTGTADPLISLSGGSLTGGTHFVHARGFATGGSLPASLTLSGTLLTMSGTTMNVSGNLLRLADGGSLSSTASDPLVSLAGGSFTGPPAGSGLGGSLLRMFSETGQAGTSLSIAGPYLVSSGTNYTGPDAVAFNIADGATINSSGSGAFASFTGGTLTSASSFVVIDGKTSFTTPGQPTTVGNGVAPVFNLAGPLLSFKNNSVTTGNSTTNTSGLMFMSNSSTLTSTSTAPLFSFDSVNADLGGGVSIRRSESIATPTTLTLAGPLFSAVNGSNITTTSLGFGTSFGVAGASCCDSFFISQGARLVSSTTLPLIQLADSMLSAGPDAHSGGDIFGVFNTFNGAPAAELVAPASVSLSGPLLKSDSSTVSALFSLLSIGRSTLTSSSADALIQLTGSTVTLGGVNPFGSVATFGRLVNVSSSSPAGTVASPASLSLLGAGPLLLATNSDLNMTADLIGVFNGGTLSSATTAPLVQVNDGRLTTNTASGFNGFILDASGTGGPAGSGGLSTVSLNGPIYSGTGELHLAGGLANVTGGGQVILTGLEAPVFSITGGVHDVNSSPGFAMFRLLGRNITAPDADSGLSLGTDRMIRGTLQLQPDGTVTRPVPVSLLETTGATVTGQKILKIDHALLEATAPLLNLKANGATPSVLTTTGVDAVDLSFNARVASLGSGSLIRLDASTLNVNSGSLVNVNQSKLTTGGDLVNLVNGATLTLFNGPLITVSGSGFVNITGSLINFGGTGGNKVNITNSLCPCSVLGGVPVALQNGAVAINVQITNPIKNASLGLVTLSPTAAVVVVNGAGSKLTVQGK